MTVGEWLFTREAYQVNGAGSDEVLAVAER